MPSQFNIVIDSAVDISSYEYDFLYIVPVHVIISGDVYLDGEIPQNLFENKLTLGEVTTSQPSPDQFLTLYNSLQEDCKPILSLHIASELSGTYNSARLAKKQFDNITLFDTQSASIASGYLALIAIECNRKGFNIEKTISILEKAREKYVLRIVVDNIDYLHHSGRINFVLKGLLQFFNVVPILTTKNGKLERFSMTVGKRKAYNTISREAKKLIETNNVLILGHTDIINNIDLLEPLYNRTPQTFIVQIGKALITHTGPGAVGYVCGPSLDQLL